MSRELDIFFSTQDAVLTAAILNEYSDGFRFNDRTGLRVFSYIVFAISLMEGYGHVDSNWEVHVPESMWLSTEQSFGIFKTVLNRLI